MCPAAHAGDQAHMSRPSHALSLVAPGETSPDLAADARLVLAFNDVAEPRTGLVAPDAADIDAILVFGRSWTGERPLLVHCGLGISRSTAAAYILACQAEPGRLEGDIAEALRAAAPCATPNALMVALADRRLGRAGRMTAAVAAIGRGADYTPYRSFMLHVNSRELTP